MIKTIQIVWFFVGMVIVVSGIAFGAFRWMDKQQDTDSEIIENYNEDKEAEAQYRAEALEFQEFMKCSTNDLRQKVDSTLVMVSSNRLSMGVNRDIILEQIKRDSSLSKEDYIELTRPLMEDVEHLKKNYIPIPYVLR